MIILHSPRLTQCGLTVSLEAEICYGRLHKQFFGEFNFCSYRLTIRPTPILHMHQLELCQIRYVRNMTLCSKCLTA
jgi:hypothetical protein